VIKTKAWKGWVEALTEDLNMDEGDDKDKKAVIADEWPSLPSSYYVMYGKPFFNVKVAQDFKENGDKRKAWKELCYSYEDISENKLIKFNACKMKSISKGPTLWCMELEHIHQRMQKKGTKEKSEAKMIA